MSRNGDITSLAKLLAAKPSRLPEQTRERTIHTHDKLHHDKPVIIEAVSDYNGTLPPYSVVDLYNGSDTDGIIHFDTPTKSGDDPESTIYGVLLEEALSGAVAHVQISGKAIVNALVGSTKDQTGNPVYSLIVVGETVYPLDDSTDSTLGGLVSNKATNNTNLISKIPLGKAITPQSIDSQTIEVNLAISGAASTPDTATAHCATTTNVAFPFSTAITSFDNYTLADGVVVLFKDQTTQTQNGLWQYNKDAQGNVKWTRTSDSLKQGMLISVRHGTSSFGLYEVITDDPLDLDSTTNLYSVNLQLIKIGPHSMVVKSASTADETAFANAPQHAEVAMSSGDLYLVKNSSANPNKCGVYIINTTGNWTYIGQIQCVEVLLGTLSGRTRYLLTSTNAYQGGLDFYA